MSRPFNKVVVVGAGPSGLLLALLLSKHGIAVHILEAQDHLDQQPRAAHYGPAAMPELIRAGVLAEVRRRGMTTSQFVWRRFGDHSVITGFDSTVLRDVDGEDLRPTCLVLQELDQIMLDEFLGKYNGAISWQHRVVGLGQDDDRAWVDVETPGGKKRVEADYIIGCDGANSAVRKGLFGDEYPGWTWDQQIVATNTYYDFAGKFGWHDANFVIHPEHFFMAARITADGLYRVTYGEEPNLSHDELRARRREKFKTMLPGHPGPDEYEVVNFAPYKMHQRCAPRFRAGRFMLAADAAHLCNPWGGLGITGGFVDVGGLYDCLAGIWDGAADEGILDLYCEKRREKWRTVIDPISQENFRRVSDSDPATRLERDGFLQMCQRAERDSDLMRELMMGTFDVRYDFTQHYEKVNGHKLNGG
ncbi:FAD binding domain-containing protein [Colletotrichum higginsianum IMI 349063]|uniref:FAD binding domain-containing protein n=1 Tax=Colletotrichum higginsianum (strain IMI 349063) TaxID=759273 RepID=A0A1B7YIJ9_COLHI|nr:FAD binding domain-containing protein [Colletotrichum higginsianum IMI 349063]OBR11866.1 FAD binding domain-containing protein [Colletotrichum higginsianum IMI 349063]